MKYLKSITTSFLLCIFFIGTSQVVFESNEKSTIKFDKPYSFEIVNTEYCNSAIGVLGKLLIIEDCKLDEKRSFNIINIEPHYSTESLGYTYYATSLVPDEYDTVIEVTFMSNCSLPSSMTVIVKTMDKFEDSEVADYIDSYILHQK